MSGTRPAFLLAPATEKRRRGLLIVAHGECGGQRRNGFVRQVAAEALERGGFARVETAFVNVPGSISEGARRLAEYDTDVLPLFIADGYYARSLMPRELRRAGSLGRTRVLPTLGALPALPGMLAEAAADKARRAGLDARQCTVLLAAHGSSKSPACRHASERIAAALAGLEAFAAVDTGYLDEPPFIAEQIAALPRPLLVVGLFVGQGMHGEGDLSALAETHRDKRVVLVHLNDCGEKLAFALIAPLAAKRPLLAQSA